MRNTLLKETARTIHEIKLPHPTRVGIDGVSAAGKTVFADDLVKPLEDLGRHVIRASIDGFHQPPGIRYRQGSDSVSGYVEDSFDYRAVVSDILEPLGPEGELSYRSAKFNITENLPVDTPLENANADSILLFEGVMLFNDHLHDHWDYRIFIDASFDIILDRALIRDAERLGGRKQLLGKYTKRYIPGQKAYLNTYEPHLHSHSVVNNNDYHAPYFVRRNSKKS